MKIAVIGGGNIGTLLAAEFAFSGFETYVYTSKPESWKKEITVLSNNDDVLFRTDKVHVTASLEAALTGSEQIWITYPSFMFGSLCKKMLPFVRRGTAVVVVPGSGGAEFSFLPLINAGCILCGLQRVHCITRLKQYGESVYMLGKKEEVFVGTIPSCESSYYAEILSKMLNMPCKPLKNYLTVTLTPSNPILHTSRLFAMFNGYEEGVFYDRNILFYEEWNDFSSDVMLKCDSELQRLCNTIDLDLSMVKSLKDHYESSTKEQMTAKIKSIIAFKGLLSPMKMVSDNWVPDFSSRYFTADFAYGLKVICDIAHLFCVDIPNIERVWNWYYKTAHLTDKSFFVLPSIDKEEFVDIYR